MSGKPRVADRPTPSCGTTAGGLVNVVLTRFCRRVVDDPYVELFRAILAEAWEVQGVWRMPCDLPGVVQIRAQLRDDRGFRWWFEQRFAADFLDQVPDNPVMREFIKGEARGLCTSLLNSRITADSPA